jgi:hypothetical protein
MKENPAEKIINDFFKNLDIENQFYSKRLGQPVFLIGEDKLYNAIEKAIKTLSL